MPFYDAIRIGASGAGDYEVERSIRGDDDQSSPHRLTRTVQSGGNLKKFTISFWVKRSQLGDTAYSNSSGNDGQSILHTVGQSNRGWLKFDSDDTLGFDQGYDAGGSGGRLTTKSKYRDVNAWYHFLVVADYANGTATDRAKVFVNGVREEVTIDQAFTDTDGKLNSNQQHEIGYAEYGQGYTGSSWWFNFFCGYFAEFYFIDGQALDPTSFTETNATTGQLVPKEYEGTFGTTGWYLAFTDNSGVTATTLGKDYSGNGNNWTPDGFSVSAGINNDSVTDTPTNNFCTYNFLNKTNSANLHKGNLVFSQSSNDQVAVGTMAITSGKYYYEFLKVSGDNPEVGICAIDSPNPATNGQKVSFSASSSGDITGFKIALITNNGQQRNGINYGDPGAVTLTGGSAQTGAGYIGIAIDMDNKKIWYTDLSGNYFNSGDPANGTNAAYDFSSTEAANGAVPFVYFATASGDTGSVNFGQQPFNYSAPAGFKTISSNNLPDSTIALPNKHFDLAIWDGNTTLDRDITGFNFSPDWVWIKCRSNAVYSGNLKHHHVVWDTLRGVGLNTAASSSRKELTISANFEEGAAVNLTNYYGHVSVFNSDGFELDFVNGQPPLFTNQTGKTYVGWCWDAGETDSATYTVKVVSDSGNKYRFNDFGSSAVTLDLAEGGTYTFDQSDSSMSSHPMQLSETANGTHGGGSAYSTGVTYELDGSTVTASAFISGFSSASSRKLIITVASSAPTLYYYCYYHSGMGGQANTNTTLGSSNFDGTIQSRVKANTTAGFSIVTYTGNHTSGATVGHGLGATPSAFIVKARGTPNSQNRNWNIYHVKVGNTKYLQFTASAQATNSAWWNDTSPNSTTFTLGNDYDVNANVSGGDYIAYCFSEVAGYSKFGNFGGNGNSNGPFVFLGFRPRWIMYKAINDGQNWIVYDTSRLGYNDRNDALQPSNEDAEITNANIDILSNGFKLRNGLGVSNGGGIVYIYFAFAESPFKNSRAR